MGIIRTLLALVVVLQHCYPQTPTIGGRNAVQLFYIVSGFLISFVLVERKTYASLGSFYLNRALRLYPAYLVVAALTLILALVAHEPQRFIQLYETAPSSAVAFLSIVNALLIGQDWLFFFDIRHGELVYSPFVTGDSTLWHGLLAPQAWSLGVEMSFYAVAPFILTQKRRWVAFLLASCAVRFYLLQQGLGNRDPWTYRFFPSELALFLLGAFSHQVVLPACRRIAEPHRARAAVAATLLLIALGLAYAWIPLGVGMRSAALVGAFVLLLPLTFIFQNRYRFDAWVGNLSYPIYICHMLVIYVVASVGGRWAIDHPLAQALVVVVASVAFGLLLESAVSNPVERLRQRIRMRAGPGRPVTPASNDSVVRPPQPT